MPSWSMITHSWRLVRSGQCSPTWNMAVDEALFLLAKRQDRIPILRLFRWEPAAVSIGHFQDTGTPEIEQYLGQGYPLVRRPTGGLTVLHSGDLSYSIVGNVGKDGLPASRRALYRQAHEAIRDALYVVGLRPDLYAGAEQKTLAGLCNAVPMRSDLIVNGDTKIGGSAQLRGEGAVLQHGCVHLGTLLDHRLFEQSVPDAFARNMGLAFTDSSLSNEEIELAMHLQESKYTIDAWNLLGRQPDGE